MDRTGLNAAPVQKALKGIKKYKYVLLTALLGVLLFSMGTTLQVRDMPKVLKRGGVLLHRGPRTVG